MATSQSSLPDTPKYLQAEVALNQECKDLISTLPTERGAWISPLHQYQGFWHASKHIQGVLAFRKHFQAHDTDLLLVTTPKSGATWLKAMAFALVNRVRYPPADTLVQHPLLTNNPHRLVPFLEIILFGDKEVPDLTNFISPRLFATHSPFVLLPASMKHSACKVVYLCRSPRDTFVSLWHFLNKLLTPQNGNTSSLEEVFDMFCRGLTLCGPFWDHVLGYWKESLERPERVLFLKFEDMKEQPALYLRRLAEFLGYPFSSEEETRGVVDEILRLCSFDHLSNLEVNKSGKSPLGVENMAYFRRGKVGDWMNYLTPEMVDRLDRITEQKLYGSGLKF